MCLFDEAVAHAQRMAPVVRSEKLTVDGALGRVLADATTAQIDQPPFARAMMDGFALAVDGTADAGASFRVTETIAAGSMSLAKLALGSAARIMTGAPLPIGATAVARLEWCDTGAHSEVRLLRSVKAGESVQPCGDDGRRGDPLLPMGTKLSPAHLALCRAAGLATVTVSAQPRCRVVVTGNELQPQPGASLAPGQVYATNDAFLCSAIRLDGGCLGATQYVYDDPEQIQSAITAACADSDFVVVTGGVSAGDYDFVPNILSELADEVAVRRVLMRPGSPFVAARIGRTAVFALSGNPAASFVQFETLVRPAIRSTLGWSDTAFPLTGRLAHDITQKPIRHTRILRAKASIHQGEVLVDTQMAQASGQMSSFRTANCLIRLEANTVEAGTVVPMRLFDAL